MLKDTDPHDYFANTQSDTPPNLQPLSAIKTGNNQLMHKIIASNQQLIVQLMVTIKQLKKQINQKDGYIKAITLKYNQLLLYASHSMEASNSKMCISSESSMEQGQARRRGRGEQIQSMINKIIDLQQQLSFSKVQSAMKSAQILSYSLKTNKNSCASSPRRKTYTLSKSKQILQEYFEPKPPDTQSLIFQKKTSVENTSILQSWNKVINAHAHSQWRTSQFKEKSLPLIKKFVPKQLRNVVWTNLIQNKLGITNALYLELLDRREQNWMNQKVKIQIDKDIKRSFYGKTQYDTKSSLISDVCQFLQLFHIFRPDVSYVQGMTYPAIILIPILGKVRAFNLFCNLVLGNSFFRKTFSLEDNFVETSCRAFQLLLKDYQPAVYQKMKNDGIQSQIFLIEWMFTLFGRGFHFQTTLKFWDHLVFFEELAVFRMGISVFEQLGPLILDKVYEQAINLIRDFSRNIDEDRLLQSLSGSKLSQQKLLRTLQKASNLQA